VIAVGVLIGALALVGLAALVWLLWAKLLAPALDTSWRGAG
jgi:hypothetical protein